MDKSEDNYTCNVQSFYTYNVMTIKFGQCQLYATPFNFFSLADRPDVINNKSLHGIVPHYSTYLLGIPSVYCRFKYNARLSILDGYRSGGYDKANFH